MSSSPRIALLLPNLISTGGRARTMFELAQGLRALGAEAEIVVQRGKRSRFPLPEGIPVVHLGLGREAAKSKPLADYFSRSAPDALLSNGLAANVQAVRARRASGAACRVWVTTGEPISQFLGDRPQQLTRVVGQIRRWYPLADAILANSTATAEDLIRQARLAPRLVRVIPNALNLDRIRAQAAEPPDHPWFAPGGPPVVLAVARLIPQKDHATLLRAFALVRSRLAQEGREARLVILGEGPERERLASLIGELRLDDAVRLPGNLSNPCAEMARAAMLAHPSRWEGFGNVIVEALACGTPVIATTGPGGPREILEEGRWGRLVPPEDPEALAQAILAELDAMPDRAALRRRAEDFGHVTLARRYLALLEEPPRRRVAR